MNKGFISLIGLLIAILLIGFWFIKIYSGNSNSQNKKETYNESIERAEEIKILLEKRGVED